MSMQKRNVSSSTQAYLDPDHAPQGQGTLSRRTALKAAGAGMAWLLALGHTGPAMTNALAALAKGQPMTGARLADILQTRRNQWNALLAQVGVDRIEEAGVEGDWSVKQIVAHLTWYENRIVESARQLLAEGMRNPERSGLAALPMDERNAHIAAESRTRPLTDVLAEADQVFSQLMTLIKACPDELLNNPRYTGLHDDVVPWMLVAGNSYAHYQEHEQSIRAWLERGVNVQ